MTTVLQRVTPYGKCAPLRNVRDDAKLPVAGRQSVVVGHNAVTCYRVEAQALTGPEQFYLDAAYGRLDNSLEWLKIQAAQGIYLIPVTACG